MNQDLFTHIQHLISKLYDCSNDVLSYEATGQLESLFKSPEGILETMQLLHNYWSNGELIRFLDLVDRYSFLEGFHEEIESLAQELLKSKSILHANTENFNALVNQFGYDESLKLIARHLKSINR